MRDWFARAKEWFLALAMAERIAVAAIVIPIVFSLIVSLFSHLFSKQTEPTVTNANNTHISEETLVINFNESQPKVHVESPKKISFYKELNIAGVILNDNSEPIPNVIVEIPSYHVRSEPSDELGRFSIYHEGDTDGRDAEVRVKIDSYRVNHNTIDLNDKFVEIKMLKRGF